MVLFISGCIFPALSWFTFISTGLYQWKTGKYSSPVLIPFIGPILLNIWSYQSGHEWWAYLVPWTLDIGTLLFSFSLPALVKDWWEYSDVNNLKKFHSIKGNQTTEIELQKENAYIINFNWRRNKNKPDIMHTTDIGTYKKSGRDSFQLYSHAGSSRVLENIGGKFACKDRESEGDRNLDGYEFT